MSDQQKVMVSCVRALSSRRECCVLKIIWPQPFISVLGEVVIVKANFI